MKTFVGLFLSSSAFAGVICVVYWFSSHEFAGTFFLGFMCFALAFAAGYAVLAESKAELPGDDPELQLKEASGEDLGIFTKESAWPGVLAFSILWLFIGLVWSDFMIFTGLAAILFCLWRLAAESSRVGEERIETEDGREEVT